MVEPEKTKEDMLKDELMTMQARHKEAAAPDAQKNLNASAETLLDVYTVAVSGPMISTYLDADTLHKVGILRIVHCLEMLEKGTLKDINEMPVREIMGEIRRTYDGANHSSRQITKKKSGFVAMSLALIASIAVAGVAAYAAENQKPPKQMVWAFDGIFGHVDRQAAQRGFQVYKEVCAACHSLNRIAFRNLQDIGFSEAEVKALAAGYQVADGPNDQGEMFQRPGKPSDYFPSPYANEQQARALHQGAAPPDLSLIIKARKDGANYVYSLLTGFSAPPAGVQLSEGQNYNPYFPDGKLMMPPPLADGQVSYADGTQATVDQMSRDVVTFLQWASEPEMEARKQMGIKAIIYLACLTAFMYVAKRNIWRKLH